MWGARWRTMMSQLSRNFNTAHHIPRATGLNSAVCNIEQRKGRWDCTVCETMWLSAARNVKKHQFYTEDYISFIGEKDKLISLLYATFHVDIHVLVLHGTDVDLKFKVKLLSNKFDTKQRFTMSYFYHFTRWQQILYLDKFMFTASCISSNDLAFFCFCMTHTHTFTHLWSQDGGLVARKLPICFLADNHLKTGKSTYSFTTTGTVTVAPVTS